MSLIRSVERLICLSVHFTPASAACAHLALERSAARSKQLSFPSTSPKMSNFDFESIVELVTIQPLAQPSAALFRGSLIS